MNLHQRDSLALSRFLRYGPQVQRGTTADHDEISAYFAESTGLDKHKPECISPTPS